MLHSEPAKGDKCDPTCARPGNSKLWRSRPHEDPSRGVARVSAALAETVNEHSRYFARPQAKAEVTDPVPQAAKAAGSVSLVPRSASPAVMLMNVCMQCNSPVPALLCRLWPWFCRSLLPRLAALLEHRSLQRKLVCQIS